MILLLPEQFNSVKSRVSDGEINKQLHCAIPIKIDFFFDSYKVLNLNVQRVPSYRHRCQKWKLHINLISPYLQGKAPTSPPAYFLQSRAELSGSSKEDPAAKVESYEG